VVNTGGAERSSVTQVLVDKTTESVVLHTTDPFGLRDMLPRSKTLAHADWNFAVHHTLESTKVLRNLGYEVPAPIRVQYAWPGRFVPYEHQIVMSEFLTLHRRAFNLSEMGTMKTNAALWAADWLMKTGRVRKALVISPLSTLESVWQTDIFDTLPHRSAAVLHGIKARRLKYLGIAADFYILNHDGIAIGELAAEIRKRPDIDLVIVDEAGMFRNPATTKYKALAALIKSRPDLRLWLMTGTPCPNAPTDAWALARLVSPERVPQYAGAFQRDTMMKVSQFKWVPRIDAFEKAYAAMQPAIRFRKKDCISLPPVTVQDHSAQLSPAQAAAVKQLKEHMVTAATNGVKITAANAADQINKMRQVLCGALKDPATGVYHPLPHTGRLKALMDAIEMANAKVLVIVPFKGIIRLLETEVTNAGHTCAVVNGDVPPAKRVEIFKAFKTCSDPHVLLCHPQVMAHGLNLTEADMLIFYAPIYSNDEVEQVNERFNRAGQTRPMTIVRIGAHPLEWGIYKLNDVRKQGQMSILDLYNDIVLGVS
jgi:SNF2 family DNA or RNA helicase